MKRDEAAQFLLQEEFIQLNVIQEFHLRKREDSKEVIVSECLQELEAEHS